jgi:NADH:ubiquinone oxidoreductase subunit 6 (subunit J)
VITLMLFAVMLTERLEGAKVEVTSATWHRGVIAAISFNAIAAWAIAKSELPGGAQTGVNALTAPDTQALGELFLTRHVAAFEALSALLLAAMIGAIVLARKKDAK